MFCFNENASEAGENKRYGKCLHVVKLAFPHLTTKKYDFTELIVPRTVLQFRDRSKNNSSNYFGLLCPAHSYCCHEYQKLN